MCGTPNRSLTRSASVRVATSASPQMRRRNASTACLERLGEKALDMVERTFAQHLRRWVTRCRKADFERRYVLPQRASCAVHRRSSRPSGKLHLNSKQFSSHSLHTVTSPSAGYMACLSVHQQRCRDKVCDRRYTGSPTVTVPEKKIS